jgi:hypothetical protein
LGKRDALYKLPDSVKYDEGCLETGIIKESRTNLKRGIVSERQVCFAFLGESTLIEEITSVKKSNDCKHLNMKVLETYLKEENNHDFKESITENTRVKIPAIFHFCKLGYRYISSSKAKRDGTTNIVNDIFTQSLIGINSGI